MPTREQLRAMDKKIDCLNPDESLAELIHKERTAIANLHALKVNGTPMELINAARSEYQKICDRRMTVENAAKNGSVIRIM
jgi:hypothetical protein